MGTPDYIRAAQNAYNAKFDLIQVKLPKGTKERIKAIIGDDGSMAAFCVDAILETIDGYEAAERWIDDELQETTPERPQETRKEAYEESVTETLEGAGKTQGPSQAVNVAELQAVVNRKRQEQEKRKEKLEQEKEKRKEEERKQNRLEMRRYAENIRDRAKENQEQKEIVKQFMDDPFLRENVLKPERREDVVEVVGQETYDAIVKADKEWMREGTKQRERMRELEAELDQGDVPDFMDGL